MSFVSHDNPFDKFCYVPFEIMLFTSLKSKKIRTTMINNYAARN